MCGHEKGKQSYQVWTTPKSHVIQSYVPSMEPRYFLIAGYHQLSLAPDSQYITTFATSTIHSIQLRHELSQRDLPENHQRTDSRYSGCTEHQWRCHSAYCYLSWPWQGHKSSVRDVFRVCHGLTLDKNKCEFSKKSLEFVFLFRGVSLKMIDGCL